jgi:cell division protein FtsB
MPAPVETPATSSRTLTPRRTGVEPLRRKRTPHAPSGLYWRKGLNLLLIFVAVVLLVDGLVGEKGLVESIRARRESRRLAGSVERLRQENAALLDKVQRLNHDALTIESLAREELGLIRPGEVLFILRKTTRDVSSDR